MRRAEWRTRADDPKGPLGWWWRGAVESSALLRVFVTFYLVASLAILVHVVWPILPMSIVTLVLGLTHRRARGDRLASLLPDPPPPGQFRAAVAYRRADVTTGTDAMALTVVDGWLYAEGVRSHFAVRREDVRDLRTGSDRRGRLVLADESEVRLSGIDDAARITLERWWQAKALGDGEPTLPPARVHPQELAWAGAWLIASGWPIPLAILVGRFSNVAEVKDGLVVAGAILFFAVSKRAYRAFDGLIRADRIAREALVGQAPPPTSDLGRPLDEAPETRNVHAR